MEDFTKILDDSIKKAFTENLMINLLQGAFLGFLWMLFEILPPEQGILIVGFGIILFIYFRINSNKKERDRQKNIRDNVKKQWK